MSLVDAWTLSLFQNNLFEFIYLLFDEFFLGDIFNNVDQFKEIITTDDSIPINIVDLEHDEFLNFIIALRDCFYPHIVLEEKQLKCQLEEPNDVVANVLSIFLTQHLDEQLFFEFILATYLLPNAVPVYICHLLLHWRQKYHVSLS